MKRFLSFVACLCVLLSAHLSACCQIAVSFNNPSERSFSDVKRTLEQSCWQFNGFEINKTAEALEGDGAIISIMNKKARLYTPLLNTSKQFYLQFRYGILRYSTEKKSLRICLTDANNEIVRQLDQIDLTQNEANKTYEYMKSFPEAGGSYKIQISYEGSTAVPLMIDELQCSADLRYPSGCNAAPFAKDDHITGLANRTATGRVTANDTDANGEAVSSYLITKSADGTVDLSASGEFSFTPNPGFKGKETSFTYRVCDDGNNPLCSQDATVKISFMSPAPAITDIQANTKNNSVDIRWTTSDDAGVERFEIERSTDGTKFETAGIVNPPGSSGKNEYVFTDQVNERLTKKNDLFYRFKQVSREGEVNYSKTLIVRVFKTKTLASVSVAPNTIKNDIKVNFQLNENAFIVTKLTAFSGEEIIRKSTRAFTGNNSFTLEGTGNIRKGMYVLEMIINSNERMVVKVVKS